MVMFLQQEGWCFVSMTTPRTWPTREGHVRGCATLGVSVLGDGTGPADTEGVVSHAPRGFVVVVVVVVVVAVVVEQHTSLGKG